MSITWFWLKKTLENFKNIYPIKPKTQLTNNIKIKLQHDSCGSG